MWSERDKRKEFNSERERESQWRLWGFGLNKMEDGGN